MYRRLTRKNHLRAEAEGYPLGGLIETTFKNRMQGIKEISNLSAVCPPPPEAQRHPDTKTIEEAGEVDPLMEYLPSMHNTLDPILGTVCILKS